jgi:RNA polymerase primary sigma factor
LESSLQLYLREIDETPLLSATEEALLARRTQSGDAQARDHLVRANLRLVVKLARAYQGKGLDLPDLIAEGNLGLFRAAEAFDPAMQTRFSTYASYWVRQSIRRALIHSGRTVRLPAYMAQLLGQWRWAAARLGKELGRPPAEEEVSRRLGLSPRRFRLVQKAIRIHNTLPQGERGDEDRSLGERVADPRAPAPGARLEQDEELRKVLRLVDELGDREKAVLRLRFGLAGEDPKSLQEVGDWFGLTRERVRQIERTALDKLSEMLAVCKKPCKDPTPRRRRRATAPPRAGTPAPRPAPAPASSTPDASWSPVTG